MKQDLRQHEGRNWSSWNQWLLWIGLAAAVSWLVLRHGAHLLEVSPFLLLLACPLMHLFRHGGHGHGAPPAGAATQNNDPPLGSDDDTNAAATANGRPASALDTKDSRT